MPKPKPMQKPKQKQNQKQKYQHRRHLQQQIIKSTYAKQKIQKLMENPERAASKGSTFPLPTVLKRPANFYCNWPRLEAEKCHARQAETGKDDDLPSFSRALSRRLWLRGDKTKFIVVPGLTIFFRVKNAKWFIFKVNNKNTGIERTIENEFGNVIEIGIDIESVIEN